MITTYKIPYRDGELRIGWASWDDGHYESRSIKYAYRDSSGKISRGSPELPFDILVDMLLLAADQGELNSAMPKSSTKTPRDVSQSSTAELKDEKKALSVTLTRMQAMVLEWPWANWQPIYDQLGARLMLLKRKSPRDNRNANAPDSYLQLTGKCGFP